MRSASLRFFPVPGRGFSCPSCGSRFSENAIPAPTATPPHVSEFPCPECGKDLRAGCRPAKGRFEDPQTRTGFDVERVELA
jgi:hypothetical protein